MSQHEETLPPDLLAPPPLNHCVRPFQGQSPDQGPAERQDRASSLTSASNASNHAHEHGQRPLQARYESVPAEDGRPNDQTGCLPSPSSSAPVSARAQRPAGVRDMPTNVLSHSDALEDAPEEAPESEARPAEAEDKCTDSNDVNVVLDGRIHISGSGTTVHAEPNDNRALLNYAIRIMDQWGAITRQDSINAGGCMSQNNADNNGHDEALAGSRTGVRAGVQGADPDAASATALDISRHYCNKRRRCNIVVKTGIHVYGENNAIRSPSHLLDGHLLSLHYGTNSRQANQANQANQGNPAYQANRALLAQQTGQGIYPGYAGFAQGQVFHGPYGPAFPGQGAGQGGYPQGLVANQAPRTVNRGIGQPQRGDFLGFGGTQLGPGTTYEQVLQAAGQGIGVYPNGANMNMAQGNYGQVMLQRQNGSAQMQMPNRAVGPNFDARANAARQGQNTGQGQNAGQARAAGQRQQANYFQSECQTQNQAPAKGAGKGEKDE